jgi:NADPH-dependent 2,4-dienoyl-CoA reductase/sulfur reductase-like enzyme
MTERRRLDRVAIVGASLAGITAAESLRTRGYGGSITMVGAEHHRPYDRPPLSKRLLQGTWEADRTQLRSAEALAGLGLDWRLGQAAVALDPTTREIRLADGGTVGYDAALLCTGTTARQLPHPTPLRGIHTLRTLEDAVAIRAALDRAPRVAVVGGGFIGAEVAAEARRRGLAVTMLEALPVPLSRGLGERMGRLCADLHVRHGVDVRCGVTVRGFDGDAGRLSRVLLSDGTAVDADLAVVGIGSAPATDWLAGSGLLVDDGVVCDPFCRSSAPGVYAAGDVARWHNGLFGVQTRIEHWTNAREQAIAAVATMLADHGAGGEPTPYSPVPYVWSDQYGSRIQVAGRPSPHVDAVRVVHRDDATDATVALYRDGDTLIGALAINAPKLLLPYRRMIADRIRWEDALTAC